MDTLQEQIAVLFEICKSLGAEVEESKAQLSLAAKQRSGLAEQQMQMQMQRARERRARAMGQLGGALSGLFS